MRTCQYCGGGIAEPGEATSWAGKWCHCIPNHRSGTPYDSESVEDYIKRHMEKQVKDVKKPRLSHIVNLCEQLSKDELRVLADVIKVMHDLKESK